MSQINKTLKYFRYEYSNVSRNPTLGMQFLQMRHGQLLGFNLLFFESFSGEFVYLIFSGTKLQTIGS